MNPIGETPSGLSPRASQPRGASKNEVKVKNMEGKLIVISGFSGAGKGTVIRRMMQEHYPNFMPMADFDETHERVHGYIGIGTKMGEGWLLTAEMLELISEGVNNIICTQPFGCLPNHIAGKGMMKPIKEKNPGVNIVAIDYDPGATAINQENRIKLMLSNAER
jgi:predicted nucleotide-binding protein (sugar kinase/HSP70/actin superfamily)